MRTILALIIGAFLSAPAYAAVSETNTWQLTANSGATSLTISATVTPVAGRVETAFVASHNSSGTASCPVLTVPSGWTVHGTSTCSAASYGNEWWILTHTASSGDTSYSFTFTATGGTIYASGVVLEASGANSSVPIDVLAFSNCAGSTTISAPSLSTTLSGDLLVSGWATSSHGPVSGVTSGWTQVNDGSAYAEYTTIAYQAQASAGPNGTIQATYGTAPGDYPQCFSIGIAPAAVASTGINQFLILHAGGPHQSIAIVPSTIPALPDTWVYADGTNNDNKSTTLDEMNRLLDMCEADGQTEYSSSSAFSFDQCPGGGWPYMSYTMLEPYTSGASVVNPFEGNYKDGSAGGGAGTCPSPWNAAYPYKQTSGSYLFDFSSATNNNVLNFAKGTTTGTNGDALVGYMGSDYHLYPNLNSPLLQTTTNQIIQNCSFGGGSGTKVVAFDLAKGGFSDNTHGGLESQHAGLWDAHTSAHYAEGGNWAGGTSISPAPSGCTTPCYASSIGIGAPSSFFSGGNPKTQNAYVNSNCGSSAGDTTCETTTYPADTSYNSAIVSFVDSIQHRDGSPFLSVLNGMYNGYDACSILNAARNAYMGVKEFATLAPGTTIGGIYYGEDGVPNSDNVLRQLINVASADADCGGRRFALLDYYNSSKYGNQAAGTSAPGTPAYEMQMREHFGFLWALTDDAYPQMMVSWAQACIQSCPQSEWTDIFAANFATVSGQVEPYFAHALSSGGAECSTESYYFYSYTGQSCSSGGVLDQNNTVSTAGGTCTAGSTACVIRRVFNHFYVWNTNACASYSRANWGANCTIDIGPIAIFINVSGSSVTLSQNFFNAALGSSVWAQMKYIIEPGCEGLSGLYGNTAGSPIYPNDGLSGTASPTVECQSGTYWDAVGGSHMGGWLLSNETSIGTSTGPTLHDQGVFMIAAGTP